MANEIVVSAPTGQTLYALVRNAAGQLYTSLSSAFEVYSAANYAHYVQALVEQAPTGYYLGSMPLTLGVQGRYVVQVKQQAGASAAASDLSLGAQALRWNGSAEVDVLAYGSGADPASLILATPQDKLLTNAAGQVDVDWSQAIPASASGLTLGRAALAAIAEGVGVWKYDPVAKTLVEYAEDGVTVLRSFALTIDASGTITQRA